MRAVIQRVSEASVTVNQKVVGEISHGLLVLLGVDQGDEQDDLKFIVKKTTALRIFNDDNGKMNLSIDQVQGQILVVSQFTLLGDTRKGNRPSFIQAAQPEKAHKFYKEFVALIREQGISVSMGVFGADMKVRLVNDGPVTILLDSHHRHRPR